MNWRSNGNIFLKVRPGVRLNEQIDLSIVTLEPWFAEAGLEAWVTSGIRTSEDQLETIQKYAVRNGVDKEYPEILNCLYTDKSEDGLYVWQKAWSKLLNIGVIVNPPVPARCLFDYLRNGENRKGTLIGHSPHYTGRALDLGGGSDKSPVNEAEVVKKAISARAPYIKGYLLEPKNNCCHVDIY